MAPFLRTGDQTQRPLGDVIGGVSTDISALISQEVALAKAELRQSGRRAAVGSALFAAAGVVVAFALLFLSLAAWWGLGLLVGNAWSGLILGGFWLLVAAVAVLIAIRAFKRIDGAPETVASLKSLSRTLAPKRSRR